MKLPRKYADCVRREARGSVSRQKARSRCYYKLYRSRGRARHT